jgi:hypothetical protein
LYDHDPRTDPRPGDMIRSGSALVRVDRVALNTVLCAVFWAEETQPHSIYSMPISEWIVSTISSTAVDLPADDPRHSSIILAAP